MCRGRASRSEPPMEEWEQQEGKASHTHGVISPSAAAPERHPHGRHGIPPGRLKAQPRRHPRQNLQTRLLPSHPPACLPLESGRSPLAAPPTFALNSAREPDLSREEAGPHPSLPTGAEGRGQPRRIAGKAIPEHVQSSPHPPTSCLAPFPGSCEPGSASRSSLNSSLRIAATRPPPSASSF